MEDSILVDRPIIIIIFTGDKVVEFNTTIQEGTVTQHISNNWPILSDICSWKRIGAKC